MGIVLDSKLDIKFHFNQKIYKCNKLIGLITLSQCPKECLTHYIYISFIRFHLDYGNILYDKPEKENFQNKLEKVQFRACLVISGQHKEHQGKTFMMN